MDRNKKILIIGGIIEGAILLFALILSIIIWTTMPDPNAYADPNDFYAAIDANGPLIAFFQRNTNQFFVIVCVPVFVLIAIDFVYLAIIATKKESNLSDDQLAAIKKKAEEEVRAEMMKELQEEITEEDSKK